MNEQVRRFYNQHVKEEDQRLQYHVFEMPITFHYLEKYLKPGDKVLDIACGTGNYAFSLLKHQYQVGLNDISDENIRLVEKRFRGNSNVIGISRADALESELWEIAQWDAVLMLGPLYHYTNPEKRNSLLKKAYQHVRPGGYVFSAFMSRVGATIFGMKNNPDGIFKPKGPAYLWQFGTAEDFIEETETFHHAHTYFSHPDELNPLLENAGFKSLNLIGIEGIFGERFEDFHRMTKDQQEAWLQFTIDHCEDKIMVYQSKHLLNVAQK